MTTTTYYRLRKSGNLKNLRKVSEELALPQENEVTVSVQAIGLNYADLFTVLGLYKAAPQKDLVPGLEFSGVITALGSGVKDLHIGDAVFGVRKFGAYATHLNIDSRYVIRIPEGYGFNQAAAFPVQGLTAWYALKKLGDLQQGQTVLIHSAAGGVGLLANRIAKKYDAYTIGVVGNESKIELLKQEGFDKIIVRSSNFSKDLEKALGGRPLHLILETTGGQFMKWSYEQLAPMGRMICYGSASFTPAGSSPNYLKLAGQYIFRPKFDPLSMITANKSIMAFNLIWIYEQVDELKNSLQELMRLNLPPPYIGHEFDFEELPEALKLFQSGKTMGKIIIKVKS